MFVRDKKTQLVSVGVLFFCVGVGHWGVLPGGRGFISFCVV